MNLHSSSGLFSVPATTNKHCHKHSFTPGYVHSRHMTTEQPLGFRYKAVPTRSRENSSCLAAQEGIASGSGDTAINRSAMDCTLLLSF